MDQELRPITVRFEIDSDKFVTLERDTITDTTHIDLHDTFMATITRLASFCDGKFTFYTNNNTTQFIKIMRSQPTLKQQLNEVSIPVDDFDNFKSNLTKAIVENAIVKTLSKLAGSINSAVQPLTSIIF
jgi:hypothetical protein